MEKYTDEQIFQNVRDFHKKHGRVPTIKDDFQPCRPTIVRRFGSFKNLLIRAGVEVPDYIEKFGKFKSMNPVEIISAVQEYLDEYGAVDAAIYDDLRPEHLPNRNTIKQLTGLTWVQMKTACGYPTDPPSRIITSQKELIKHYFEYRKKLSGKKPTMISLGQTYGLNWHRFYDIISSYNILHEYYDSVGGVLPSGDIKI